MKGTINMIRIMPWASIAEDEILSRSVRTENVQRTVSEIIANVRANGDAALKEYAKKFDRAEIENLLVTEVEIEEAFEQVDSELLDVIRTAQPDAKIILQGIIMVSKIKSTENACFDPGNLRSMNERIAALADGETVFYIDANVVFVGEDGYLYPHLSGDGCHFYPEYAVDWAEWISLEAAKLGI